MALPASEDFAGGAGALSGNWTQLRTADTVNRNGSGVGIGSVDAKDLFAIFTGEQWSNDQRVFARIAGGLASGAQFLQLMVRGGQPGDATYDGYIFYTDGVSGGTHCEIARVVNGVATVILTAIAVAFATNDVAGLEVIGKTIRAYKNGAVIATVTDTNAAAIASGVPGVGVFGNAVTVDDWFAENVPSAAPLLGNLHVGPNRGGIPA